MEVGDLSEYMTQGEVAEELGISRATVWRWCKRGKIKGTRIGSVTIYHRDTLVGLVRDRRGRKKDAISRVSAVRIRFRAGIYPPVLASLLLGRHGGQAGGLDNSRQ